MDAHLSQFAFHFLLGGLLGYLSGTMGTGGGLIVLPLFTLVFGMDQQAAQGTSLAVMTPNLIIGFWRYRQRNPITLRMAAYVGVGAMVASYVAARIATEMSGQLLRVMVALFMAGLACNMFWRNVTSSHGPASRTIAPEWMLSLAGIFGGSCAGFFTIGGGVMSVPLLTAYFGLTQTAAQGLAQAMMLPGSLVALFIYSHLGLVNWAVCIPMSIGSALTISHGVELAHRLPERKLRAIFAMMLLASAGMMLMR